MRKSTLFVIWLFLLLTLSVSAVRTTLAGQTFSNPTGRVIYGKTGSNCIHFKPDSTSALPPPDAVIGPAIRFRYNLKGNEHFVESVRVRLHGGEISIDVKDYKYDPENVRNETVSDFNTLQAAKTLFRICFSSEITGSAGVSDLQLIIDWKTPADFGHKKREDTNTTP